MVAGAATSVDIVEERLLAFSGMVVVRIQERLGWERRARLELSRVSCGSESKASYDQHPWSKHSRRGWVFCAPNFAVDFGVSWWTRFLKVTYCEPRKCTFQSNSLKLQHGTWRSLSANSETSRSHARWTRSSVQYTAGASDGRRITHAISAASSAEKQNLSNFIYNEAI